MQRLRLDIEYDGTDFAGWQAQPRLRTVQGMIGDALETILKCPVNVVGAGRTDAGVHARGQVAHVDVPGLELDTRRLGEGINAMAGRDVAIRRVTAVPREFHARFSAISRTYRYRMSRAKRALDRTTVWRLRGEVDTVEMNRASTLVVGRYVATSWCAAAADDREAEVDVARARLFEEDDLIVFEITANRFVMHMVRTIIGTLVQVGMGRRTAESVAETIAAKDRSLAGPTAPAHGLCLEHVGYVE